ncbi:hypothetical protein NDU88_004098 [Pleurodeles waltl]|uniref:Uncharacterized protein n=1 Tax=Pleurodeles waltl TaxID=8319 RepID=A0AAV7W409_PLEWA|nr:hypothetical protein NDU88_004098 [Pleurodeles waltl]
MHPAGLRLDRWPHRRRALQIEVVAGRSEKPGTHPGGGSLLPKCQRDPLTGRNTPGERHHPDVRRRGKRSEDLEGVERDGKWRHPPPPSLQQQGEAQWPDGPVPAFPWALARTRPKLARGGSWGQTVSQEVEDGTLRQSKILGSRSYMVGSGQSGSKDQGPSRDGARPAAGVPDPEGGEAWV